MAGALRKSSGATKLICAMTDYTASSYHEKRHPELLQSEELLIAWSHFADDAYFSHVQRGQSVLEYGGGLGNNLVAVSRRAKVSMVEPSSLGRATAGKHGIAAVERLDALTGCPCFDTVLCRHVLEHIDHPLLCLQELSRHLVTGGRLVIVVPVESNDLKPCANDLNHHLYCWNPQTLCNLLQKSGFELLEWHHEFYGARRKLLPVYRKLGGRAYAKCVRFVGKIFRFRELVVVARLSVDKSHS